MKKEKSLSKLTVPSSSDDWAVQFVRMGNSKKEKNFMMNDPRFSKEAMERRSNRRAVISTRRRMKEIMDKFGK